MAGIFPRKKAWGMRYLRWLQEQQFDHPAHQIVLQEMVEAVRLAKERVERLERPIEEFLPAWSLAPVVRALQALRGVDLIVAVTFVTEVGDLAPLREPAAAHGLSRPGAERALDRRHRPARRHHQGRQSAGPAHAGRERLDLPASATDRRARSSTAWSSVPPKVREIAWKAQTRLTARYRALAGRGKRTTVVCTAIARELAGFMWSVAREVQASMT